MLSGGLEKGAFFEVLNARRFWVYLTVLPVWSFDLFD